MSGASRLRKAVVISATVLVLVSLFLFVWPINVPGLFFRVPDTRDTGLVGSWEIFPSTRPRKIEFFGNGTFQATGLWRMQWGTRDGTLYAKCRSAGEGWDTATASYRVLDGGRTIEFMGKPSFMIPRIMYRSK
jgi:hypothetical protein